MQNANLPGLRWGIIPCANIARARWIPGIRAGGGLVTAIASRAPEKARAWAAECAIPQAHGSYAELLDDPQVDAVFIALPNSLHCEWAIRALEKGKHVLVDKPLCVNAGEARQMAAAAERRQRLLLEGFMYQYHAQFERLRQWIDAGEIGPLRMMRIAFGVMFDLQAENFRWHADLGGGALLDVGCYCVHLLRKLAQAEPLRVRATARMHRGVDASATAILEFPGELTAVMDCGFSYAGERFLHVAGTKGILGSERPFGSDAGINLFLKKNGQTITEELPPVNTYELLIRDFHALAAAGKFTPSPARASIGNLATLDAILASARGNQVVEVQS